MNTFSRGAVLSRGKPAQSDAFQALSEHYDLTLKTYRRLLRALRDNGIDYPFIRHPIRLALRLKFREQLTAAQKRWSHSQIHEALTAIETDARPEKDSQKLSRMLLELKGRPELC